ncbi:putative secreted protein [Wickerhamomyces ciferrii]|uniref:Secreted protein n=1 Tax=Wickerhamomyces ciferrii (strain ATCC 14091 / BCRC 22168 / CBS 111 / JCM 3599 / NBRC 0793 / NRRL Y-1031 F-60-10) TaxID=1206466 RepID=K0L0Q4_WICCF|nr:uncharacterized protein BN7_6642 [Wickerhamomyces ciferrii]CCH47033.1 putative secreted protein [Wickerhamomyces ciferrii]
MKLSSIVAQGVFLSGILASGNSTDEVTNKAKVPGPVLCFEANQSRYCHKHDVQKCVVEYKGQSGPYQRSTKDALSYCSFFCSKIKNVDDCRDMKNKFEYFPNWYCADVPYC